MIGNAMHIVYRIYKPVLSSLAIWRVSWSARCSVHVYTGRITTLVWHMYGTRNSSDLWISVGLSYLFYWCMKSLFFQSSGRYTHTCASNPEIGNAATILFYDSAGRKNSQARSVSLVFTTKNGKVFIRNPVHPSKLQTNIRFQAGYKKNKITTSYQILMRCFSAKM